MDDSADILACKRRNPFQTTYALPVMRWQRVRRVIRKAARCFLMLSPAVLLRGFSKFTQPCMCFSAPQGCTYSYAGRQLSVLDQLVFVFSA